MSQIKTWQQRQAETGIGSIEARDDEILDLRQAIEQAKKADQEAGFEMWWGEFMPSAFRDRAWGAWTMAHPKVEQAEKVEPVGSVVEDDNDFGRVKAILDQDARVQLAVGTQLYTHPPTAAPQEDERCWKCGEDGGTSCGAAHCGLLEDEFDSATGCNER